MQPSGFTPSGNQPASHDPLTDLARVESAALDLLPSGIGIFDNDFNLAYANRSFRELRLLPERLCIRGTRLEDIVHYIAARGDYGTGEVDALVRDRMAEILTLKPWGDEQDIEDRRRLAILHTPVPGRGLMITYADVTKERATERKLRENEERYSRVTEAVAEGIYDWNVVDNSLYVSDRVMEILGFEGQLTSYDWYSRVHPDEAEMYRRVLRECFRGETAKVACEYRIKAADGGFRWVEDHGLPIRDEAGRVKRLVGAVSDVTMRHQTEQALRIRDQELNAILDTIDYGVLFMGPDLRAKITNRAFRKMWGISDEFIQNNRPTMADLINYNRHTDLYDVPSEEFDGYVARRVEAVRVGTQIALEMRRRDGRIIKHQMEVLPDGGRMLTYFDVTEFRRSEELASQARDVAETTLAELRVAQDRLVQTEKLASLGQLTAGIAHEIKNPLNFVNNFSALSAELVGEMNNILAGATPDKKMRGELSELAQLLKSNLEKIVQHGKRADSIVKNMLQHSREGPGEHRSANINAIVDESLNLAYHGARAETTGFSIAFRRDLDPSVGMADVYPQEITRALLNLISNGFYAATKRKAEVGDGFEPMLSAATKNLGDKVEIRIRDNGTGIPEGIKEKVFNPFFTTKPSGEGTGLGLSMTHDIIVKQHGGRIDVATELGEFTEFIITLPRENASGSKPG